jgi:hypothetical protein
MCGKINERAVNTAPSINNISRRLKANETQGAQRRPKVRSARL